VFRKSCPLSWRRARLNVARKSNGVSITEVGIRLRKLLHAFIHRLMDAGNP